MKRMPEEKIAKKYDQNSATGVPGRIRIPVSRVGKGLNALEGKKSTAVCSSDREPWRLFCHGHFPLVME